MKHLLMLSNASHISRVLATLPKIKKWLVAYSEVCEPLDPCVVRSSTTMIWLCKTNGPTSFTRMTFKNLCHFSDDKWLKIQVNWYVSKMNSTWQIFLSFTDNTKKIPYDNIALQFHDNDNDNDNDNENNFIVMKLHFHSLYKSNSIPNKDYFSLAKKT